jgi:anti-sigma-K factor RskA
MISDELQDQAALYVLEMLDAHESAQFEEALKGNAELGALLRDLREAAGDMGGSAPAQTPPAEIRRRVLGQIAFEKQTSHRPNKTAKPGFSPNWLTWAMAALFLGFCGILAVDRAHLQKELTAARASDSLSKTMFVRLESPNEQMPGASVTVAWQPDRQSGMISMAKMPPAGAGHDYQLWIVDANHKDPISAGILHIDANGIAQITFKTAEAASQVKAFAVSLEREGGAPKREGPIVLIGKA